MTTLTFINNPQLPFRVQQVGTMVQIKPFAGYYIWLDWFDLAPLDFAPAVDILTDLILDVNDIATDALVEAAAASAAASTAQAAAEAAQADATAALAAGGAVGYPSSYFINPRSMKVNSGGFGAFAVAATDVMNGLYVMTGINSEVEVKLPLNAGNYKFMIVCAKYAGGGRITLFVDNNDAGEIETYSAAVLRNQEIQWTLSGLAKGLHTFHIKITDKHTSGGYNLACNYMSIWQT